MNGDEGEGNARTCRLAERVSDLQDLSEMAANIRIRAVQLEVRLLGHSGPHGDKTQVKDTSELSFVAELRNYTRLTRESLQTISDSVHRIENDLGDIGMGKPGGEPDSSAPIFEKR